MTTEEKRKILVPTGFSEQSLEALDQSVVFAKAMNAEIILLSVIEESNFFTRLISDDKSRLDKLRKDVHEKLNELAEKYRKTEGVDIETVVAQGVVYEEIKRVCDMTGAELVIMGTNGRPGNFRKKMIGTNAYRTVCLVEPPVITIRGGHPLQKIENIIFPLVLERESREKVGPAIRYARLFDAHIKLVAFVRNQEEEKKLMPYLRQVESFMKDSNVSCTAELISDPNIKSNTKATIDYAHEKKGDLIMITEDGSEPTFAEMLLSSEVRDMIYHSDIPVMSVTPTHTRHSSGFSNW